MEESLRQQIEAEYNKRFPPKSFIPGDSSVPITGKVFDDKEMVNAVEAVLEGWWTEGHFAEEFEGKFSKFLGVRYVSLVNSGSSANLAAFSAAFFAISWSKCSIIKFFKKLSRKLFLS